VEDAFIGTVVFAFGNLHQDAVSRHADAWYEGLAIQI
jgi:hypothetical protein